MLNEILIACGAIGFQQKRTLGLDVLRKSPPRTEIIELLEKYSIASFEEVISEATLTELERARDEIKLLISFLYAFLKHVSSVTGIHDPLGLRTILGTEVNNEAKLMKEIPIILLLKTKVNKEKELEKFLDTCREYLPTYEALGRFLDDLPKEYWRFLGPGGRGKLADLVKQKPELIAQTNLWMKKHPQDAAILSREM